jgi:hypothetical protein
MAIVHVFVSTGRFGSFEEMRSYIDKIYNGDGDGIPSKFMREVGLSSYEPGCIEALHSEHPISVAELLAPVSYSNEWLPHLSDDEVADSAICVFEPNLLETPRGCSLDYYGAFEYKP